MAAPDSPSTKADLIFFVGFAVVAGSLFFLASGLRAAVLAVLGGAIGIGAVAVVRRSRRRR